MVSQSAGADLAPAVVPAPIGAPRDGVALTVRAAVTASQAHHCLKLPGTVVTSLFHVGLSLQAAVDLPAEVTRQHITDAVEHLDDIIREIRDTAFTARGHDIAGPAPLHGAS